MRKSIITILSLISFEATGLYAQSLKDIEGNVYETTVIGKQTWMSENLKTTKFNDGSPIPLVTGNDAWKALKVPAYCWFENKVENKDVFGALYNWYTVDTKKLCPLGWHVPSAGDWKILMSVIGDADKAGDKLKVTGDEYWKNSLTIVTNEFNFSALPGGFRLYTGGFPDANSYAVFWSATGYNDFEAWNWGLYFSSSKLYNGFDIKRAGLSVRCVKNN